MYAASLEEMMWAKVREIQVEAKARGKSSEGRAAKKASTRRQEARRGV